MGFSIYSQIKAENCNFTRFGSTKFDLCVYKDSAVRATAIVGISCDDDDESDSDDIATNIKEGVHLQQIEMRLDSKKSKKA